MKPIEETHPSLRREYPKINERTYDNANYSARDIQKHTVDRTIVQRDYVSKQVLKEQIDELFSTEFYLEELWHVINCGPSTTIEHRIQAHIKASLYNKLGLDE